ncbi:RNA polymerase sigma-70 factor [Flavitalea sp. BT771]|uniref:RNA polymerase sigma-70 factor n=1 Tax=Flavitalea sp. BT771 TaxID=3063329 RepID=UPI0026E40FAF|nr:RNA polymerase sigma-70 factor [Flavitalea sp. BT771]MDO6429862.1 RNA polymerase sigma-70 factor [Flavitalea sp. BT771]MDV6218010.1 RNA polymerase sigma-70 factor [Flavitalea sp. BT771]
MSPIEEKIWRSIQKRDGQAFEHYYKEHYRTFLLAACNYLKDPGLAQEVVNDVFLRLWEDAGSITIQSSLKAYIYRAVVNRSLNELDKHKRERAHQAELRHRPEETFELKEMEENELKIRLYKAIDQLPEQCLRVFRMSRFEELKQQEIADRLGISIKTVKNHITHALKQLNRVLSDWNSLPVWLLMIKYFFWHFN